jgi:predicted MFS family arabinose efflux permease
MNGLFSLGGALGALSTAYTAEAFGRLRTIQLACCICIIGASLMTGAANIAMFLASRFIMGWGIGQIVCAGNLGPPFH